MVGPAPSALDPQGWSPRSPPRPRALAADTSGSLLPKRELSAYCRLSHTYTVPGPWDSVVTPDLAPAPGADT